MNVGAADVNIRAKNKGTILALDIGNSNITVGVITHRESQVFCRFATDLQAIPEEYSDWLEKAIRGAGLSAFEFEVSVIGSVVPSLTVVVAEAVRIATGTSPIVVDTTSFPDMRVLVDTPGEVGVDRLSNCAAVGHLFGGPAVVVDLGSATTFDVVDEDGNYRGGVIAPGAHMIGRALSRDTAQLPLVEFAKPRQIIGKSTVECMESGIYWGYVHMIRGLLESLFVELKYRPKVIATGGLAGKVEEDLELIDEVVPELTVVGLVLAYEQVEN